MTSIRRTNRSCSTFQPVVPSTWPRCFAAALFAGSLFLLSPLAAALTAQDPEPKDPQIVSASDEGEEAIGQFKYPEDVKCELYAAEPDVANIVALHRDFQGRLFVCETFRQEFGVEDNRRHAHWMDEELQAKTVQDRIDYIKKYIPDAEESYTANDDRIRLLVDQDGDGKPDRVTVFAQHFNKLEMGTGAGVLSYRDKVYYTCIPDLFMLTDNNDDGVADERKSLHTGYGVRFAFRGHDLHGLTMGPDGRLYFSIGDRGYNITPDIKDPVSGAVFRCELDGSNLEVIATGLRNPQELAFDDFGNLFTGDNNSDSGDMARWVYLVPGSDSGWRMYYQYLEDRGPFNREEIWKPFSENTPPYIVPPITNISDGPSGVEYYPGTGFGDNFKGRFFMVDFRGQAALSGVRSFRMKTNGAFFDLVDDEQPFWNMLVTDLDFGSDGKLYMSDWVFGWNGENKGRIYAFHDSEKINSKEVKEVEQVLREGMQDRASEALETLLAHADQRVRRESQFELASRGDLKTLMSVAQNSDQQLARLHAMWGMSQIFRAAKSGEKIQGLAATDAIIPALLADKDIEVRAQATQLAVDANLSSLTEKIVPMLADENLRVRYFAAMALSKIGNSDVVQPTVQMLIDNDNADPIVRHGGIMVLSELLKKIESDPVTAKAVFQIRENKAPSARLALVVALRKAMLNTSLSENSELNSVLGQLMQDTDRTVFSEAIRTIYELRAPSLMSALADKITKLDSLMTGDILTDMIVRRVLNANIIVGSSENAKSLAKFASNDLFEKERRIEAINALANWMEPPARDGVLNDWRPIDVSQRKVEDAKSALLNRFASLIDSDEAVASAAIEAAGKLELKDIGSSLAMVVENETLSASTRSSALKSLQAVKYDAIDKLVAKLKKKFDSLPGEIAATLAGLVGEKDAAEGLTMVQAILKRNGDGLMTAKQTAIANIGDWNDEASAKWLAQSIDAVSKTNFPETLRLDVVMASEERSEKEVKDRLKNYNEELAAYEDPSMKYIDTLHGGDAEAGKKIFVGKTEVSCVRCHRIDGSGGKVGPDLSGVAVKNDRKYILDSLVNPNKAITEGYAQMKIQTADGNLHTGIIKMESDDEIQLMDADGKRTLLHKDDIEGMKPGLSAMPDDVIKFLTPAEIRDLVEYLAQRKMPAAAPVEHE